MVSQIEAALPKPNNNTTLFNLHKHVCERVRVFRNAKSLTLQIIDYLSYQGRRKRELLTFYIYIDALKRQNALIRSFFFETV